MSFNTSNFSLDRLENILQYLDRICARDEKGFLNLNGVNLSSLLDKMGYKKLTPQSPSQTDSGYSETQEQ